MERYEHSIESHMLEPHVVGPWILYEAAAARIAELEAEIVERRKDYSACIRDQDARIAELEAQLAAAQERWIPVSERLPDSIAPVLVNTGEFEDTTESNNLYIAVLHGKDWLLRTASGTDVIRITGTHWRELPAPPQEAADDHK